VQSQDRCAGIKANFLDKRPGKNTSKEKVFPVDKRNHITLPAFNKGSYSVGNLLFRKGMKAVVDTP
jgi:hypothetical protein